MYSVKYELLKKDGRARRGVLSTPHGRIQTPVFMPVGTAGTVKAMKPETVRETGAEIILANTYHLFLRPGHETVRKAGGLHRFMNWDRPILTDSGGFQVFSLGKLRKISEEGVEFASFIDGSKRMLSPEISIEVQQALGSDIMMAFDECAPPDADRDYVEKSADLTVRWLKRCKDAWTDRETQSLFGIMQGGMFRDLRESCARAVVDLDLPGYSIGGLSVGEPKETMLGVLDYAADLLPEDKPRYLMGVGTPDYIFEGVERGIDMFDCVLPTRLARHGRVMTSHGEMNIKNAAFREDFRPLDEECGCYVCRNYSRAYLRHTLTAGEMIAPMLLSEHNVYFLVNMMKGIRESIEKGRFGEYKEEFYRKYGYIK